MVMPHGLHVSSHSCLAVILCGSEKMMRRLLSSIHAQAPISADHSAILPSTQSRDVESMKTAENERRSAIHVRAIRGLSEQAMTRKGEPVVSKSGMQCRAVHYCKEVKELSYEKNGRDTRQQPSELRAHPH